MESVLFIGNSYTYYNDLPSLFAALAEENGHAVRVDSVTKGARKLSEYRKEDDPYTEALHALLSERNYAVAILQEQSLLPLTGEGTFRLGVEHLLTLLDGKADRILLYQTWARRKDHPTLARQGWTVEEMAKGLRDAYRRTAEAVGAEVSPVGDAFFALLSAEPECALYAEDGTHPSYLGSALAAVVHYRSVFGALPCSLASLGLPEDALSSILSAVGEVFKK